MQIKFTKNMSCEDGGKCSDSFRTKFLDKFGRDNTTWHFSCLHVNGKHQFWFYFYDTDGRFENEHLGKIKHVEDKRVKKYPGTIPTQKEIEDLF